MIFLVLLGSRVWLMSIEILLVSTKYFLFYQSFFFSTATTCPLRLRGPPPPAVAVWD